MATISEKALADAFLAELGAPQTPLMEKAVTAWMRAESGRTVKANNPWNMTVGAASETGISTCGSWTSLSSGLHFAVFCTPQDGARASARLLLHGGNDWRGYGAVVTQARAGNPVGFLNALARSAWDGGRYGTKNGGPNRLLAVYASITGLGLSTLGGVGGGSTGGGAPNAILASINSWAAWLHKGPNDIFTIADYNAIAADPAFNWDAAHAADLAFIKSFVGQPFSALDSGYQAKNGVGNPLDALGSIAKTLGDVGAALLDPHKWLLFFALIAGAGLTAWGGVNIARAAA